MGGPPSKYKRPLQKHSGRARLPQNTKRKVLWQNSSTARYKAGGAPRKCRYPLQSHSGRAQIPLRTHLGRAQLLQNTRWEAHPANARNHCRPTLGELELRIHNSRRPLRAHGEGSSPTLTHCRATPGALESRIHVNANVWEPRGVKPRFRRRAPFGELDWRTHEHANA